MNTTITETDLSAYGHYLLEEERSPATREKYLHDVRAFALWLGDRPLTREQAAAWKESLLTSGRATSTVNAAISALNGFLTFSGRADCRVRFLRVQKTMFRNSDRDLDQEEYQRLVTSARNAGRERLAMLLETICATGIRVSEVHYITVEAVRQRRAEIKLKGKIRTILIPGKLARKLLKYARTKKIASGEIFLTRSGRPVSRRQIWAEMKAICRAAGVDPRKVFPHNLRHLFAKTYYKVCGDVARLASLLGHSSVETTRIYLLTSSLEHIHQLDRLRLVQ